MFRDAFNRARQISKNKTIANRLRRQRIDDLRLFRDLCSEDPAVKANAQFSCKSMELDDKLRLRKFLAEIPNNKLSLEDLLNIK